MSNDDETTTQNDAGEWGRTVAKVMSEIGESIPDESRSIVVETLLRYRFQFHDAGVADRRSARRDAEKLIAAARAENQRKRQELQDEFSRVARRLRRELLDLPGEVIEVPDQALNPDRPAGDVVVELLRLINQAGQTARGRSVRELAALEDRRVGLVLDLDDTNSAVEEIRNQIKSARSELETCQVELADAQREVSETEVRRDQVQDDYRDIEERLETARSEFESSRSEIDSLSEQRDRAVSRLASLAEELTGVESDIDAALATQDELTSEVNELETRRDAARHERDELGAEREGLEAAVAQLNLEIEMAEGHLKNVRAEIDAAEAEERLLRTTMEDLSDEMVATETKSRELADELLELQGHRDVTSIEIAEADKKLELLRKSYSETVSAIEEARSSLSELNLERSGLDVEMTARRDELHRTEQRLETTTASFQKTLDDRDSLANEYDSLMMELHQLRQRRDDFLMPAHHGDYPEPQPGLMVLASVIDRDHAIEESAAQPRADVAPSEIAEFGGFTRAASGEIDDVFDSSGADLGLEEDGFDRRLATILNDTDEVG